jgi:hypothetical protein
MTDTLKIEVTQTDEQNQQVISKLTVEWYGVNRYEANELTMGLVDAMSGTIKMANEKKYSTKTQVSR